MENFGTIAVTSADELKTAIAKAQKAGLILKTGSGMVVPEELQKKAGQTLKGTFTGKSEVRQTRAKDGVYVAHQFSYEGKNYFILGNSDSVYPKGTEMEFKVAEREIQRENESVTVYGFELGKITEGVKAPVINKRSAKVN